MQTPGIDGNSINCINSLLAPWAAATNSYREPKPIACIATKKGM